MACSDVRSYYSCGHSSTPQVLYWFSGGAGEWPIFCGIMAVVGVRGHEQPSGIKPPTLQMMGAGFFQARCRVIFPSVIGISSDTAIVSTVPGNINYFHQVGRTKGACLSLSSSGLVRRNYVRITQIVRPMGLRGRGNVSEHAWDFLWERISGGITESS
ncbi:hypothetical protein HOY80DRAFT_674042 [Tuber brumale]|nr:hypothetical protein HOY80DRAFT_674042 [Tuber brumale]